MRKIFYISVCGFLGLLTATLIHAGVELFALDLIFNNPARFSETVWWQEWELIHGVASAVLWIGGLLFGLAAGRAWYPRYGVPGARSPRTR